MFHLLSAILSLLEGQGFLKKKHTIKLTVCYTSTPQIQTSFLETTFSKQSICLDKQLRHSFISFSYFSLVPYITQYSVAPTVFSTSCLHMFMNCSVSHFKTLHYCLVSSFRTGGSCEKENQAEISLNPIHS